MATSIALVELKKRLADGKNVCLIDVRRAADYEGSPEMIAGATWENPEKVEEWSKKIPQDKELVVYCVKGGTVSQSTADTLEKWHPKVRFLEGGILGWQKGESYKLSEQFKI